MTNLTPAQLEQFESTFRYFDKDESNTLLATEMIAALASLGIVYSEEDMDLIYNQLVQHYGAVTFEAFINLLASSLSEDLSPFAYSAQVDITEDQTSSEQLREAFHGIAGDKVNAVLPLSRVANWRLTLPQSFVTELDLRIAHLPNTAIEYLREAMPSAPNMAGEAEYDYERWLDEVFA